MWRGNLLGTCLSLFIAAGCGSALQAQTGDPRLSGLPGSRQSPRPNDVGSEEDNSEFRDVRIRMLNARKEQQRKRIVDSANRLVEATRQLREELETRPATAEDEKRLDEIAHLARQVKDQMANQ